MFSEEDRKMTPEEFNAMKRASETKKSVCIVEQENITDKLEQGKMMSKADGLIRMIDWVNKALSKETRLKEGFVIQEKYLIGLSIKTLQNKDSSQANVTRAFEVLKTTLDVASARGLFSLEESAQIMEVFRIFV